jgi:hypothetical protein
VGEAKRVARRVGTFIAASRNKFSGNYTIKLIVCNGAKICVEDESRGIIVDSSPPTPGKF